MMKKALSTIIVLALLVLTFTSCNIETVKEHDAKTSSSETASHIEPTGEEITSDNGDSHTSVATTASSGNTTKSDSATENVVPDQGANGQESTKYDEPKVTTQSSSNDSKTTQGEKPPEKPAVQPQSIRVTVSVICKNAVGNESLEAGIDLPKDGFIINGLSIDVKKGASVFDATKMACEKSGTTFLFSGSMFGKYVSKIGPIAEKECGDGSGWTYTVNGEYPNITCDSVPLKNGDKIEWIYKVA